MTLTGGHQRAKLALNISNALFTGGPGTTFSLRNIDLDIAGG